MFQNKNVVITGAGRGIGRELALAFAAEGAKVMIHYGHHRQDAEEVARMIGEQGGSAVLAQADLASAKEVARLVEQARKMLGPLDVWVNNAGASVNTSENRGLSEVERFERVMAVDVTGTWLCCRNASEHIREGGCILNTGWNHAIDGAPGLVSQLYATSKGAVISLSRCLARELAPHVRVNCIAPGWIENDWSRGRSQDFHERVTENIPLNRWGTAGDVVAAALFLASPAASFITGQVLVVDGGEVMH